MACHWGATPAPFAVPSQRPPTTFSRSSRRPSYSAPATSSEIPSKSRTTVRRVIAAEGSRLAVGNPPRERMLRNHRAKRKIVARNHRGVGRRKTKMTSINRVATTGDFATRPEADDAEYFRWIGIWRPTSTFIDLPGRRRSSRRSSITRRAWSCIQLRVVQNFAVWLHLRRWNLSHDQRICYHYGLDNRASQPRYRLLPLVFPRLLTLTK